MDRTTLARNARVLEKKGLINIESGENQRMRFVSLTDKGIELLRLAIPLWQATQTRFINEIGEKRLGHILDGIAELAEVVEKR